jgi:hypothetical protein
MIVADLITEGTRTALTDVGLILGTLTAVGAVGLRWLRKEIRAEVGSQTAEFHKALAEVRRDLRPNGGSSAGDAISHQIAQLVAELMRRNENHIQEGP